MTDSSSFTSLLALVDSHLSQTSVQESIRKQELASRSIAIPHNANRSGISDPRLSQEKYLEATSVSPIKSVLNEQIMNMLKAKEERLRKESLEAKMKEMKVEDEEPLIDLTTALCINDPTYFSAPKKELSRSSSTDSVKELFLRLGNFELEDEEEDKSQKTVEKLLPCIQDMSYILHTVPRTKCSTFGKIISARLKPVPTPYVREIVPSSIIPFDFKTKSPCDLIKSKLHKHVTVMDGLLEELKNMSK